MSAQMLHLMRHGAPLNPGRLLGWTDDPSTDEGLALCVERAGGLGIGRIVVSDLCRARAAGEAIAGADTQGMIVDPRWRELNFGRWDGLFPDEIDGDALRRFWEDPSANPPPDGERWPDLVARVAAAIRDLPAAPVLVVTHAGAMRAALSLLCGLSHRQAWAFDLPYASLLSLKLWAGEDLPSAQICGLCA